MGFRKAARSYVNRAATQLYGESAGKVSSALTKAIFAKQRSKPLPSTPVSKLVQATKLGSYLDRTYAKKCGVEVKYKQVANPGGAITTALVVSNWQPLEDIAIGTGPGARIGSDVEVKSVNTTFQFRAAVLSTRPCLVRIIIIKQGLTTGTRIASSQLLTNTTDVLSFPPKDTKNRPFSVIKDQKFWVFPNASGPGSARVMTFNYRPKSCHHLNYTAGGTTGAVGEILEGNMSMYIMYEGDVAPTYNYYYESDWVDL